MTLSALSVCPYLSKAVHPFTKAKHEFSSSPDPTHPEPVSFPLNVLLPTTIPFSINLYPPVNLYDWKNKRKQNKTKQVAILKDSWYVLRNCLIPLCSRASPHLQATWLFSCETPNCHFTWNKLPATTHTACQRLSLSLPINVLPALRSPLRHPATTFFSQPPNLRASPEPILAEGLYMLSSGWLNC